jgi:hypothetical protein
VAPTEQGAAWQRARVRLCHFRSALCQKTFQFRLLLLYVALAIECSCNVTAVDGNKLTIKFDKAGEKRVVDSFIEKI